MRLRRAVDSATGWRSLIIASMLITGTTAKEEAPSLKLNTFNNPPVNIEYFDDSDVILFQDWMASKVYKTEDAGESWSEVKEIPDVWSMYMHPFDKKRAYVLTRESKHYKTDDRGKTWQSFLTDSSPSVYRNPPLSFHADDPDKIIFNGEDCLGIYCEEVVRKLSWQLRSESIQLNFLGDVHQGWLLYGCETASRRHWRLLLGEVDRHFYHWQPGSGCGQDIMYCEGRIL
jgi:hypothetical protein